MDQSIPGETRRARPSGTSRTRPGSSRRSCCARTPGYAALDRATTISSTPTTNAVGERCTRARRAAADPADGRRESSRTARTSTHAMERLSAMARRRTQSPPRRARAQPRAAAPGAAAHRHQARASREPAPAGLSRRSPGGTTAHAAPLDWQRRFEGGLGRDRHDGEALRVRQRGPAPPRVPASRSTSPIAARDQCRVSRVHRRRRLSRAGALWLSDGWAVVQTQQWEAPLYWERDGTGWQVFTLSGMHPVDPSASVCHVSYYEADAFARWAGARLPTEAEWERGARPGRGRGQLRSITTAICILTPPARRTTRGHPVRRRLGMDAEPLRAYPGYRRRRPLGEYNGKFMCNQMVLRGGSCATPPGHVRATYRNFFPPDSRWQFTGIRLAKDEP